MKNKCLFCLSIFLLFFFSNLSAQAPSLGSVDKFVLFTTTGAVSNSGLSHITGNVGTGTGMVTGFGNVDGVMHNTNGTTATAGADLGNAVAQINGAMQTALHGVNLGTPAGETLNAGVYDIAGSTTLNGILNLDAQNNANAVFIIRVSAGTFSAGSTSEVKLLNGAKACNVFWKIEGAVSIGTGTIMKGTIIANNAAIDLLSGVLLEGRAFSTTGAVAVHTVTAVMPLGCGTPILRGPTAPMLGPTSCYGLFSSSGSVTNMGTTSVVGDVGTNMGTTSGFTAANVTGTLHLSPDAETGKAATALTNVATVLGALTPDIELLYPADFGNTLVLTPHTYRLSGMTTLTDVLYLNAQGNVDAVFVFQITGSLNVNANASVVLQNGAQAKNVFWQVPGVISMANNSVFKGTIVGSAAINISAGTTLVGRALTTSGAVNTNAIAVAIPSVCDMTIPVTWLYITAKPVDNDVLVEWATADEINNRYFIIEKSKDGKVFQAIETVNTLGNLVKGEHRYAFTDKEPFSIAYYRILQVDNDEQKRYSRTVQVSTNQGFKASHSVRGNSIYIETSGASSGTGSIELYNIDGRLISSQKVAMGKEESTYKIEKPPLDGLYLLYISKQGEKTYVGKVMVLSY